MRKLSLLLKTLLYSQRLATLSLCCLLIFMVQFQAFAQRGRPHLDNSMGFNRLLTDNQLDVYLLDRKENDLEQLFIDLTSAQS